MDLFGFHSSGIHQPQPTNSGQLSRALFFYPDEIDPDQARCAHQIFRL